MIGQCITLYIKQQSAVNIAKLENDDELYEILKRKEREEKVYMVPKGKINLGI